MPDIIKVLPDSVANQIAAGEVIQRPASVVKELMENAIDAGASGIRVNITDAGRTLIQVIDDGCGMSAPDARVAFERHATSKISTTEDLFAIRSLGFRGEALASVAAVAEVELKTRRTEDELGTGIRISGSEIREEEPVSCPTGSNFQIRNLFFNIPARRKFLKSNTTEFRHIVNEFNRVALCNPALQFTLTHNGAEIYNLPPSQVKQRIINLFGKSLNQVLLPVQNKTSIVSLLGFIGKPVAAKKSFGEQFFFVNKRYIKHPYFHKAVMAAYEKVLPPETIPSYFIYFEADTKTIDINVHPSKTEVKFEDERSIYQIIHATAREALGRHSMVPSLDFDREGDIDIPVLKKGTQISAPRENIDPDYNPFETDTGEAYSRTEGYKARQENLAHWESLYRDLEKAERTVTEAIKDSTGRTGDPAALWQFKQKFILIAVKSGLMVVDQERAHERILYEKYCKALDDREPLAQQELFPVRLELGSEDHELLIEIFDDICSLGFELRVIGGNTVEIKGIPADMNKQDPGEWLQKLIADFKDREADLRIETGQRIAAALARSGSIRPGRALQREEMQVLMDQLFACREPATTPDGKRVFMILPTEDIEKMFN